MENEDNENGLERGYYRSISIRILCVIDPLLILVFYSHFFWCYTVAYKALNDALNR